MRLAAFLLLGLISVSAFAQVPNLKVRKQPIQIRIRHADPWAVKALLEGGEIRSPEISTILNLMGMGGGGGGLGQGGPGAGNGGAGGGAAPGPGGAGAGGNGTRNGNGGLFPDGKFIVNPADNSLWFIPNN